MPEPLDFYPTAGVKKGLLDLFRERFQLPVEAFAGLSEAQFQQQILEVWLDSIK